MSDAPSPHLLDHEATPEEGALTLPVAPRAPADAALLLCHPAPSETRVSAIIGDTFALLKQRPEEVIGHGMVLSALNMGLSGMLQLALQPLIIGLVAITLPLMMASEPLGVAVFVAGGALTLGLSMVAAMAINAATMGGYKLLLLKMIRGQEGTLDDARAITPSILPLVAASALSMLGVSLGFGALVVPGVVLMLGWIFHGFFVIDHGMSARQALAASWKATRGHKLNLLILLTLLGITNLLGLLTCGVGLFISYPLSIGCLAVYYDRLVRPGNVYELDVADPAHMLKGDLLRSRVLTDASPLEPYAS